ncbi:hypothetical protein JW877_03690 [bacterium]|nr:hypothetical protein [bacterium]
MRKVFWLFFIILILLISESSSFNYKVDYLKNINTYSLLHQLNYYTIPRGLKWLQLEGYYSANMTPSYSGEKDLQLNHITDGRLLIEKMVRSVDMGLNLEASQDVFEEEHTEDYKAVLTNKFYWRNLDFQIGLGGRHFDRFRGAASVKDNGYLAEGAIAWVPGNFKLKAAGLLEGFEVMPQKYYEFNLTYDPQLLRGFADLYFDAGHSFRDENYFVPAVSTEEINNKRSTRQYLKVSMLGKLLDWIQPEFQLEAGRTDIDYVSEGKDSATAERLEKFSWEEQYFYGGYFLNFGLNWLNSRIGYLYELNKTDYGDDNRDEDRERGELVFSNQLNINRDTMKVDYSIDLIRFDDKRDSLISGTRDLQSQLFKTGYTHVFSDYFRFGAEFLIRSNHKYYIYSSLSASNNLEKTYLLIPKLIFSTHSGLSITQEFPIRATYVLYDASKDETEQPPHRLLREGKWSSTIRRDYGNFAWEIYYAPTLKDYGRLVWKEQWVEWLSWERISHQGKVGLYWQILPQFNLYSEFIGEVRDEWSWEENELSGDIEKTFKSKLERKDLSVGITLTPSIYADFIANISYRNDRYPLNKETKEYITISLKADLSY